MTERRCKVGDFAVYTGTHNTAEDNPNRGRVVRIVRWVGKKEASGTFNTDYWRVEGELINQASRSKTRGAPMSVPYARDSCLTPLTGTPQEIVRQLVTLVVASELVS
jgi:hypothetical protein